MAEQQTHPVQTTQTTEEKVAKKPVRRKSTKKSERPLVVKSKRKTTVARAYIKPGNGMIRINGKDINALEFNAAKAIMTEPVVISNQAQDQLKKVNIKVNVYGGGVSSQIQAVRSAIAKGLVESSKSESLKKEYLNYDRTLLVDDPRRVEPKKFKGPKARARFQTSYR